MTPSNRIGTAALSRRELLGFGAVAVPAAVLLADRLAAQDFGQVPLPPDAARADPLHSFWDGLHREFPGDGSLRYFNVAGLGLQPFEVLQRVHDVALEMATRGELERAKYFDSARQTVARLLGAGQSEIALVRNATEAMNIVARGIPLRRGDEVILTTHEHPGGAAPWIALAQDAGVVVRLYDPSFDPTRDAVEIWKLASKRTRALVVSHVVSTIGALLPVEAIAAEAQRRGIWSVVDGAQSAGILPVNVHALGVDCYVASGHKWLLGPVETGLLYVREARLAEMRTEYAGAYAADAAGYSLEERRLQFLPAAHRYEYGTRSSALVAGLEAAIVWQEAVGLDLVRARSVALAKRFRAGVSTLPGVEVLTPAASVETVPIVALRVSRRPNQQVADWLRTELGMRVRVVSERNLNAVRAAFHVANRRPDVDWLVEAIRVLGT